jgi:hypothetical protein
MNSSYSATKQLKDQWYTSNRKVTYSTASTTTCLLPGQADQMSPRCSKQQNIASNNRSSETEFKLEHMWRVLSIQLK